MITRPLDLAAKLRPPPRSFDFLFFVNAGLIVLFFQLFGSRFVLAPGLGVDFKLPQLPGATNGAPRTAETVTISVKKDGLIIGEPGQLSLIELRQWLASRGQRINRPILLVRADASVSMAILAEIWTAGRDAGFEVVLGAEATPESKPALR